MAENRSSQALSIMRAAFNDFSRIVSAEDGRQFTDTRLEDVRNAALEIEKQLVARRDNRNMRRLHPFLQGLDHYSKSVEILCNGTPYLPWIWAPVKLMLQLSVDHLGAFDVLIDAYGRIAETLPRFDLLSAALQDNFNFQAVLALFYADILEFHRRAYKFVRRRSWKFFFDSTWTRFNTRFDSILSSLSRHSELVDKEAVAIDISEAKEWRRKSSEQADQKEKERTDAQLVSVFSWLCHGRETQEDELDRLLRASSPNSCDWIYNNPEMQSWVADRPDHALLWLHGKPGAGKSVICSSLVQSLQDQGASVFYHFCSYRTASSENSTKILRWLAVQMIQKFPYAAEKVYDDHLLRYPVPSLRVLKRLLPDILIGIPSSRIIIDGIDECAPEEQKFIIEDMVSLISTNPSSYICKVLISSRDVYSISRTLQRKVRSAGNAAEVSLSSAHQAIDNAIEGFINNQLSELRDDLNSFDVDGDGIIVSNIRSILLENANGMFLWVHLVLKSLEKAYSMKQLLEAVRSLPRGLPELYKRIVTRLRDEGDTHNFDTILRMLRWISFAKRPLKKCELLSGMALTSETPVIDEKAVLVDRAVEICKPLIEELPDGSISLIHFSVKEFFTSPFADTVIRELDAHHDIAFACAALLSAGLDLIDPSLTEQQRLLRIGSGAYSFVPYAADLWTEHLLAYANSFESLYPDSLIMRQYTELHDKHSRMASASQKTDAGVRDETSTCSSDKVDDRLNKLSHVPIHNLVSTVLSLRMLLDNMKFENGEDAEKFALEHDRTLISELTKTFNGAVHRLLKASTVPGISKDKILAFRRLYSSTAFRCRFLQCPDISVGFPSEELRNQHEVQHVQRVFCDTAGCSWNRIGFKNRGDLAAHASKYHTECRLSIPPKVRRERRPTESFKSATILRNLGLPDQYISEVNVGNSVENPADISNLGNNVPAQEQRVEDEDMDKTDPDEPTYCYCNGVSYGEMVGCDARDCEREWFHLECVGLKVAPKGRKWYCDDCQRKQDRRPSSHWSVPEQTDFPALLKHFGTDWHGIAKFMTSKTHIMVYATLFQEWLTVPSDNNKSRLVANIQSQVRNYYQRQVDWGEMKEWEGFTREADSRKKRGEAPLDLPPPTLVPKSRYNSTGTPSTLPRSGSAGS